MSSDARSAYRQGLGQNANPLRLVVLLYEQLIEDLRKAKLAIENGNVESRTNHLSHAMAVLGELDASLNMEAGRDVAQNLSYFYGLLRSGLFHVQVHPNGGILEKHIANLLALREAWIEVEGKSVAKSEQANGPADRHESEERDDTKLQGDWRA